MAAKKQPLAAIKNLDLDTVSSDKTGETVSKEKSYVPPSRAGKKGVMVYLPEDCHHRLKVLALENRSTLQAQFEGMISQYLEDNGIDPTQYFT